MSLKSEIENYKKGHLQNLEKKKEFYEKMSLTDAIKNAAIGSTPFGTMDSHQRRVGKRKGELGANELLKEEARIKNRKTFEEIFKITEEVRRRVNGLGPLWSYDTTLRVGFNKRVYPNEVYVQSGVVKGVKKALNGKIPKGRSLPMSIFKDEFQNLEPYQLENFLCIWGKDGKKSNC